MQKSVRMNESIVNKLKETFPECSINEAVGRLIDNHIDANKIADEVESTVFKIFNMVIKKKLERMEDKFADFEEEMRHRQ
ncbi:MAG: hypothetical protein ACTSQY_10520 [Candidatus Odinarchaeia archaeon]